MYSSIIEAVLEHGINNPDKLAIADTERSYTYGELAGVISQMAAELSALFIQPGSYVLAECTQDARFLILDMACELLGAVFVPLEKKMTEERVKTIYEETKAQCIIGETDYSQLGRYYSMESVWKQLDRFPTQAYQYTEKFSVAEILFTTGTTGKPKGIVISHHANVAIAENIQYGVRMTSETVELIPLPLSHSHGLRTCYANLLNGSAVVILDGVMNVGLFFQLIDGFHVNAIDISPTLAKLLLKIARKGLQKYAGTITYMEIGTAVLDEDTKEKLKTIFPASRLYNFYGSTEAGRSCVLDFNKTDFKGCIGYPSKNATFYIVNEDREVMESSKENPGLIAVKGSMMMDCYLNSEQLTRDTLVDGVLYTSDLGYIDEAGRVYVLGRNDDIINYKGIKIAPEEIETIAAKYDGIVDCACVPVQDVLCGQVPKLFIEISRTEEYDEKKFMDYLKNNLEQSRVPAAIEVIDKIPRSANGKLQRKKLRGEENEEKK